MSYSVLDLTIKGCVSYSRGALVSGDYITAFYWLGCAVNQNLRKMYREDNRRIEKLFYYVFCNVEYDFVKDWSNYESGLYLVNPLYLEGSSDLEYSKDTFEKLHIFAKGLSCLRDSKELYRNMEFFRMM